MRIVAKIATAGASGVSRFPILSASIDECLNDKGRLDEQKARQSLDCEQIQFSSKDDLRVIAFAMEYLTQMETVVGRLMAKVNEQGECAGGISEVPGYREEAATLGDFRCERNMKKGRYVFVRTDITSRADGIHVKLSVQNPKGVVGNAERFARNFAMTCGRILNYLRENITTAPIVLMEGDGVDGIFAEAAELDRKGELEQKRKSCPNHHNGFCSPSNPTCPLYRNGRCREP